jgi:hypothetical protein
MADRLQADRVSKQLSQDSDTAAVKKILQQKDENDKKQHEQQMKVLQPQLQKIDNTIRKVQTTSNNINTQNTNNIKHGSELEDEIDEFKSTLPHW